MKTYPATSLSPKSLSSLLLAGGLMALAGCSSKDPAPAPSGQSGGASGSGGSAGQSARGGAAGTPSAGGTGGGVVGGTGGGATSSGGTGGQSNPPGSGGAPGSGGGGAAPDAPGGEAAPAGGDTFKIFWIDAEGGAATLLAAPTGETLLVDAGFPGARDSGRVLSVLKNQLNRMQLDYFVATHYHVDHIGGLEALARAVPIMNFIDHGNSVEGGDGGYRGAIGPMKRMSVTPGQKIMLGSVEITVVTAAGQVVAPLPSAAANPLCEGAQNKNDVADEDPQSVGILARLGKFEFVDLGDLTWGVEHRLACPMNRLGQVEIFQSSQHGANESNPPQLVHALAPQAIVVNCGAGKGGQGQAMATFQASPGMKHVWQVHRANAAGNSNSADEFIANAGGADMAHFIRADIKADGSFTITNGRTNMSKAYTSR